jgi:hypothetical protein
VGKETFLSFDFLSRDVPRILWWVEHIIQLGSCPIRRITSTELLIAYAIHAIFRQN